MDDAEDKSFLFGGYKEKQGWYKSIQYRLDEKHTKYIFASCVDENVIHTGCKLVSYYDSDDEDEEDDFVTIALNTIQWTGP